jgi:hypothetical protein
MLEFVSMLAIVALVFCTATVFVALIAGGILKVSQSMKQKAAQKTAV